jgi:nucleoside-diphosphate-sugar epimerase
MNIFCLVRDSKKAEKIFDNFLNDAALHFVTGDVMSVNHGDRLGGLSHGDRLSGSGPDSGTDDIDFIFHAASVTESKFIVEHPIETTKISVLGTMNMLDLALAKSCKKFIYFSSMEVYGDMGEVNAGEKITEDMLGYIDTKNVRSCYPLSKRLCENLCMAYSAERGLNTTVARLSQVFGAGILESENRVFAQFARSAMKNEDIVLHTEGCSEGNYCYTRDAVTALLFLAAKGDNSEIYNVVNEDNWATIKKMAKLVTEKIAGGKIALKIQPPKNAAALGYAPDVKLRLSAAKINSLGWKAEVNLEEMYRRMIADMRK